MEIFLLDYGTLYVHLLALRDHSRAQFIVLKMELVSIGETTMVQLLETMNFYSIFHANKALRF